MENIDEEKIQINKNDIPIIDNYNINIINNSSNNQYIFNFDSLLQKLKINKNKKANLLNEFHCNLLMVFFKKEKILIKLYLS